ncbi:replication-relaxation family protein [Streptomyces cocklensis]|uniref:Replication-relaxation n=1 Tax=Actinacidiphila cocklensis TaxID=887465 RepID=A0A9W4DPW1_9ACTN|nr:replication-relaxation family protein [Actinacidiphila cocklensis]MDD1062594.1 replication-relaxation family protein [Actinacidiphila cocklensis]CAG6391838.1 Replication-relaxation [Actinacidiphila cocklensis]
MADTAGSVTGPRVKVGKQARRPRSAVRDREDVLRVLGVLKVATATQIMELVRPHLSDNKQIRNALLVLQTEKKVISEGSTAGPAGKFGAPDRRGEPSQKLWGLTKAGLDSAAIKLKREPDVMGGHARGAGTGGAPHAMAVNATVVAFTRGGTLPGSPAGIGGIESWRTEVAHPLSSSGKRNVRADAVFQDKDAGVPLLMVEVDRATESAHVLADKVGAYADFYARRVRDPGLPASTGRGTIGEMNTVPFWETLYRRTGLPGLPPLAIVLTGAGPTALDSRMRAVGQLSREFWAGQEHADYRYGSTAADDGDFYLDFTGKVPLVMTTLDRLQQHGPMGPVWFRVAQERGREPEPLLQALTDTHTAAEYRQRRTQRERAAEAAEAQKQRRKAAEQQRLDEEWERSEWFEKRKRKVKKLARLWDEPKTEDER